MKSTKTVQLIIFIIVSPCFFIFVSTWLQLKFFKRAIFMSALESFDSQTATIFSSLWIWGLAFDFLTLIMVFIQIGFKGTGSFPGPVGVFCYFLYSIINPDLLFITSHRTSIEINSFLKVLEFIGLTIFSILMVLVPEIVLSISEKIGNWFESIGLENIASLISSRKIESQNKKTNFD